MNKAEKERILSALIERDGYRCMMPGCTRPFTQEDKPTIDHWNPKSIFGDESLSNLRLMHFVCNNLKGNIVPNPDGTITLNRFAKLPKQERPGLCELCMSGRLLLDDETCPVCGSGPQPKRFPTAYKRKPKNCAHSGREHCFMCVIGFIERKDAYA